MMILGIKIKKNNYGCLLCHAHYIKKMLRKFNRIDLTSVRTSYIYGIHLKYKGFGIHI